MGKLFVLAAIFIGSLAPGVETVTILDRTEPHEALTFHAGFLWVGSSRTNFNSDFKVKIFDNKNQLVKEIPLTHSIQNLYPYHAGAVLAVGTGISPNLTKFTIVSLKNSTFSAKTTTVPMDAWANKWLGTINGREFFSDPGGNPNDTSTNPTIAAQTLFSMNGSLPRYLSTRLRLPIGGISLNSKLFVVQKEGIGDGRSNLAIVDPATEQLTFAFSSFRRNLAGVVSIPGTTLVALSERDADQVIVFDTSRLTTVAELKTVPEPRAIGAFGRCVLTGSFSGRSVQIFKKTDQGYEAALTLSMDLSANDFARLSQLAVNGTTGQVFARSNFPCNPMMEVCDKDWNRIVSWTAEAPQVLTACK